MTTTGLRGKRYGEVLLVDAGPDGPQARVYNTYPLNDCPPELWGQLDAQALAAEHGAVAALLNGPRYWLMDAIEKNMGEDREIVMFGGLDMYRQAVVTLSSMNPAPYVPNTVARNATFVFDGGAPVFELVDADGGQWVMQTWSQIVDPTLSYGDLPELAGRLTLPEGWTYRVRTLESDLRVDTSSQAALVLQDGLTNSYSLVSSG
ncbi:hypothetical protein FK535_23440 [Mycolicibacterium sp. 018/SC-01/001]|uniref:hypothetical protein n=1 Tax=Mycolicibacterium sp. 018/SC-01/001 TaxID=2592069 RepID=UPI00117E50E2|nr:hypothetical protein [Mycolicibacterium sp. 018/SC-01/001]TRW78962.1 hypothetical protein FK535_23440 [Mycolicibacterium sp. 018/SC-01/001]